MSMAAVVTNRRQYENASCKTIAGAAIESRETCSFGTPDAVVCKAARSASAVLAAVGRSVGIAARAGGWIELCDGRTLSNSRGH